MGVEDLEQAIASVALTDEERLRFLDMCAARSDEELDADRLRVAARVNELRIAAEDDALIDLQLVTAIGDTLDALLARADEYSWEERRFVAGAVEYFLADRDLLDDEVSPIGFTDDGRVVRAVARVVGHAGLADGIIS